MLYPLIYDDPLNDPDKFNLWDLPDDPDLDPAHVKAVQDECFKAPNASPEAIEEAERDIQDERILYDLIAEDEAKEGWSEEEDYEPPDVEIEAYIPESQEESQLVKRYKLSEGSPSVKRYQL